MNCNDCSGLLPHGCVCNQRYAATAPTGQDQPADQSQAKQAEYPPLPEPFYRMEPHLRKAWADQMRAYVDADRAARAGFVLVPVDVHRRACDAIEMSAEYRLGNPGFERALADLQRSARPRGAGD